MFVVSICFYDGNLFIGVFVVVCYHKDLLFVKRKLYKQTTSFENIQPNIYGWGDCMRNKKIFNVFFREKPAMMLVTLLTSTNEHYASSLAKVVDCTYSHIVKILNEMQKAGLITFKKQGRLKVLKLTEKGQKVAQSIDDIRTNL